MSRALAVVVVGALVVYGARTYWDAHEDPDARAWHEMMDRHLAAARPRPARRRTR